MVSRFLQEGLDEFRDGLPVGAFAWVVNSFWLFWLEMGQDLLVRLLTDRGAPAL